MSAFDGTFDRIAPVYDARRPGYPEPVFETIEKYAPLPPRPDVVEVGIGTGQATIQMAARGWSVTGIEPGAQLAETARKHYFGQTGLFLVAVDADALGDALRWEPSRHDELFPHLYG